MAENTEQREVRSFLMPRDPSIDRRFRPRPDKKVMLFADIEEEDHNDEESLYNEEDEYTDTSETSDNTAANDSGTLGTSVYLRLRPVEYPSVAYTISEENNVLITLPPTDKAIANVNKNVREKHFSFTSIFDASVSQKDIYNKCAGKYLNAEESFTMLTYGTSGSGKTFTLLGDIVCPGVIPRFLEDIFTLYTENLSSQPSIKLINGQVTILTDHDTKRELLLRERTLSYCTNLVNEYESIQQCIQLEHVFQNRNDLDGSSVYIWVTFVEIYNEKIFDLLTVNESTSRTRNNQQPQTTKKALKIIYNDGRVFINGVTSIYVKNSLEALMLLRYGQQKITYACTAINSNSSRSHCIFIVNVIKIYPSGLIKPSSYTFCDLAGSERQYKTGNAGSRFKEAQCINTSLMVLGRCLDAASTSTNRHKSDRIPLRESKLTLLLQSPLQGKEKLTMVVNVAPTDDYFEENLNVLNFASIAQSIVFKSSNASRHHSRYSALLEDPKDKIIQQQQQQIHELKNKLIYWPLRLKEELDEQEVRLRKELVDSFEQTLAETKKNMQFRLNNQKEMYESKITLLNKRYEELEEETEDLENEVENLKDELNKVKNIPKL